MSDEQTIDPQAAAVTEETPAQETVAEETPVEVAPMVKKEHAFKEKLANFEELKPGQTIRVHERIVDISPKGEERKRVQIFEGIVIGMSGAGIGRTMTVRKISGGVSVEKIYPINSPVIAKLELVKTARVRRAKLRFLLSLKNRFSRKLEETFTTETKS